MRARAIRASRHAGIVLSLLNVTEWLFQRLREAEKRDPGNEVAGHSGRHNDEKMWRNIGNAQCRTTFFRHSAVLSLLAVLLRKFPTVIQIYAFAS